MPTAPWSQVWSADSPTVVAMSTSAEFWAWWTAQGADACARAIATGDASDLVDPLSARVAAVQEGLAWELAPGTTAQHRLVVTAEGAPDLRGPARRWLREAPAPTATWEYADTRGGGDVTGAVLELGEDRLALDDLQVAATRVGNHLDVVLQHPSLALLPDDARSTVAFVALDTALGEVDVETWIGAVETAVDPVAGSVPLRDLPAVVAGVRADNLTDEGLPVWTLMRGTGPDGEVLVAATVPLSSAVAPELDDHVTVRVPYTGRTAEGFPDERSLTALRGLEDHLTDRLGGSGRLVAHETSAGTRVLHYYADSTTPAVAVLRAAVTGWGEGPVDVGAEHDPGWLGVRPFRT